MIRILAATAALALLTACGDGQPFEFGVVPPPVPVDPPPTEEELEEIERIEASIAGDVDGGASNAALSTLTVQITLDTTPVNAVYTRNPALDVPGYTAFSVQEDPLDRMFIGLVARAPGVEGIVAMDGGQFTKFFGGTTFSQVGAYAPHIPNQPDNGLVSYAGTYAGISNLPVPGGPNLLPAPIGTDPALLPSQATRVTGQIFINADFADNAVNGAVYGRTEVDTGIALPDIFLIPTEIVASGRFLGVVENAEQEGIGDYGGTFGGIGATGIAGGIHIEDYLDDAENEEEYGIFVLTQCGLAGDAAICDGVQPVF